MSEGGCVQPPASECPKRRAQRCICQLCCGRGLRLASSHATTRAPWPAGHPAKHVSKVALGTVSGPHAAQTASGPPGDAVLPAHLTHVCTAGVAFLAIRPMPLARGLRRGGATREAVSYQCVLLLVCCPVAILEVCFMRLHAKRAT